MSIDAAAAGPQVSTCRAVYTCLYQINGHGRPLRLLKCAFEVVFELLQAVVASARTLADISDERVVPVDYLVALIVLFLLMVLDRLVYSRGNCFGKASAPPAAALILLTGEAHQAELLTTVTASTLVFTMGKLCRCTSQTCRYRIMCSCC